MISRMFRATRLIFKRSSGRRLSGTRSTGGLALAYVALLFCSGCALWGASPQSNPNEPPAQVFFESYDEVWRAAQKALVHYPIQINNIEQGLIETDAIKGAQVWRAPFQKDQPTASLRYLLRVNVVRGKAAAKESVKVTILKKIIIQKDFFSAEDQKPSDGFEERAILYRISRELRMEKALRRAFEKKSI